MFDQEARGGTFLPAFFVDDAPLGAVFEPQKLPLAMTYFPPVRGRLQAMHVEKLREYIGPMETFVAHIGGDAEQIGPNGVRRVKQIESNQEVFVVYRKIVSVLQYLPQGSQLRTPYQPGIAVPAGDTRIETGDSIEIAGLSIVEMAENKRAWSVIAKIGLNGAEIRTDAAIIKKS